jgi:hypothetical protein
MVLRTQGIFSSGNMNPVKMMVGSIMPIIEMSRAVCCALVELEISNPRERQVNINKADSMYRSSRLPFISICRRKTDNNKISVKLMSERIK